MSTIVVIKRKELKTSFKIKDFIRRKISPTSHFYS